MIAHDTSDTIVLADEAELLVHDGPSEGPRWRRTLGAPIVALGSTPGAVIALLRDGRALWFDQERDRERASAEAGEEALAGVVTPEGHVLAATRSGAVLLTPKGRGRVLPWPGACAVAAAPDGRVCVADGAGAVAEFDAAGELRHQVELGGPAVAAAWNPRGFWVLATARKLMRLEGGSLHHVTNAPEDMPVRGVACAADGAIGIVLGKSLALVMSWPARDTIGQLMYIEREVKGLSFGPSPWLAVALDGGDGNKLDLQSGDLHRTDTHPGRPHRRWMVKVSVHPPEVAAPAPAASPAPAAPTRAAFSPPGAAGASSQQAPGIGMILLVLGATLGVIALIARCAL